MRKLDSYDTILANEIEVGDFIAVAGNEFEVRDILSTPDHNEVRLAVTNIATDIEDELSLLYDLRVDLVAEL